MKRLLLFFLLCAPMTESSAEIMPQPSNGDFRVQTATYDPDQVVVLRVSPENALAVEFSPAERIENVAIGSSAGWQVTANKRGDHIFVKSSFEARPTNLIVVTDARQYLFSLVVGDSSAGASPYIVRIAYPNMQPASAEIDGGPIRYKFSGARSIRPASMNDDGKTTRIVWNKETDIPAIYIVDAEGRESLVNGAMRGDAYAVDAIAEKFVFRSGKLTSYALRKTVKHK